MRWRIPLRRGGATSQIQDVPPATNVLGGNLPASRLVYRNIGPMGLYEDASQVRPVGIAPDITGARKRGSVKQGFGLNLEQELADGGGTGVFGRLGGSDGNTESFRYAEADRFVSLGGQLLEARWGRPMM